ncbi:carbohydrate ABC transporter permease [Halomarina halobia]|uniref:Carbohydrate ABC transporter permease n=1 Tax=Halomarina halobia TaxID=3033386 RepID=A0ABD6A465_9EURY|nr:sugar ABC transporter permease [Halomarina sp. PSR21]
MTGETIEPEDARGFDLPVDRLPVDRETLVGVGTVLPVVLLYLIISIIPVGFAIWASLHDIPLLNPDWTWAGVSNYAEVFRVPRFWQSLWRGVVFMVGSTLLQLVVGLWMALTLNRIARGQKLLTAVVFTAYLVPTVVVSLVALFMFDTFYGVLHVVGSEWFDLWGVNQFALGQKSLAMPLVILIGSWKFSVFITIFTLAQLRSIPPRFYEAARICGANRWQMFRDITLPRIQGVILVAVLLRSIFMFNKFDLIWILTQGGPGYATTTLPVLAYREAFVAGNYGLANAMAVVMFVFLAVGGVAYFWAFNPSEEVKT